MDKRALSELSQNQQTAMAGMVPPPSYDMATNSGGSPRFSPHHMGFTSAAPSAPMSMPMPMPMPMPGQYAPPPSNDHPLPGATFQQPIQQEPQLVRQVVYVSGTAPLGPDSTMITCPSCHFQSKTRVDYAASSKTHLMALLLCVFGLFCCACVPYCMDSCKNANHYCKNCGAFLGTYNTGSM